MVFNNGVRLFADEGEAAQFASNSRLSLRLWATPTPGYPADKLHTAYAHDLDRHLLTRAKNSISRVSPRGPVTERTLDP